ncbi:hypothetical protein SAMCCGM7_Ch2590 [Sinorhizobium americanum CCGM7]|nr:hypothetical protein SAMCCGM7_Ch2590 [Sinorhizobium americanum CCGM7]
MGRRSRQRLCLNHAARIGSAGSADALLIAIRQSVKLAHASLLHRSKKATNHYN